MNNKILLIIFVALLGVYLLSRSCGGQKDRSFDPQLVTIDTSSVSKIILNTSGDNYEDVTIQKLNGKWNISKGNISAPAMPATVSSLLAEISDIKAKRIATRNPEKWKDYEVNEGAGNRIRAFSGDKVLTDLKVGKFVPNPQTRQFTTYLKMADDDAVYAFDGYLSVGLGQNFNSFRNSKVLEFEPADITTIELAGQSFSKTNGKWASLEGVPLDSTKVADYLNGLKSLKCSDFADNFDSNNSPVTNSQTLLLKGNNLIEPINITSFVTDDPTSPFVIHSSLNKDAYFKSDSAGIVSKIFVSAAEWRE